LETLEELVSSSDIESELATLVGEVDMLLEPVAASSWWSDRSARAVALGARSGCRGPGSVQQTPDLAAASLPGVLLTQIAAIRTLARQGMDLVATPPVAVVGHSQESGPWRPWKAAGARDIELLAMAQLIGAAGTRWPADAESPFSVIARDGVDHQRRPRAHLPAAPKTSRKTSAPYCRRCCRSATARRSVVITGTPEQLSRFELYCKQISRRKKPTVRTRSAAATSSRRSSTRSGRGGLPHAEALRQHRHRR